MAALARVGELAQTKGQEVNLLLLGGGLMMLRFETRMSTHDIDVVILPPSQPSEVRALAEQVATERGWASDWLNDGAKGFMVGITRGPIVYASPGICIYQPAIEQVLAMKLCAWRDDVDVADARRLLAELPGTHEIIWRSIEPYLQPGRELKAKYAFEDLWEESHGQP